MMRNEVTSIARKDAAIVVLIMICVLAVSTVVCTLSGVLTIEDWHLYDDATIAYAAARVAQGEIPHIHFPYYYSGGFEILLGQVFSLVGESFNVAQTVLSVLMSAVAGILYLLFHHMKMTRPTAAFAAFIWSVGPFSLNFHFFPAWPAQCCVLLSLFIILRGFEGRSAVAFFVGGIALGIATAMKQTIGIYAFLGYLLAVVILFSRTAQQTPIENCSKERSTSSASATVYFLLVAVPAFFIYVVRSHPTAINFFAFVLPVAGLSFYAWRQLRTAMRGSQSGELVAKEILRVLITLAAGFAFGFGILLLYYGFHGGVREFLVESFLSVQEKTTSYLSGIDIESIERSELSSVSGRHVLVLLIPLASAALAFGRSRGVSPDRRTASSLVIVGSLLVVLNVTLFPAPIKYLFVILFPLAAIPYAYFVNEIVSVRFRRGSARIAVTVLLLCIPLGGYLGLRLISGDLNLMMDTNVCTLEVPRGGNVLPCTIVKKVLPVARFLDSLPSSTTVATYDLYNKTFAFLSGRRVEIDFGQKFNFWDLSEQDVRQFQSTIERGRTDIVVLGTKYLKPRTAEHDLLTYLNDSFEIVLSDSSYAVYRRLKSSERKHANEK